MSLISVVKTFDDVRRVLQQLASNKLGPNASPYFVGLTLTGLTASRLIATNASKALVSTGLASWVAGTDNEINIADDGNGGIIVGIVNPLIVAKGGTGAETLTDHGLLVGSGTDAITALGVAANGQIPIGSTGVDPVLATITGTTNQVNVTNAAGSITLSTPQDIHVGASPNFANVIIPSNTGKLYLGANQKGALFVDASEDLHIESLGTGETGNDIYFDYFDSVDDQYFKINAESLRWESSTGGFTFNGNMIIVGEVLAASALINSTLQFSSGSITDTGGAISFGNENLTTTGIIQAEHLYSTDDLVIDDAATITGLTRIGGTPTYIAGNAVTDSLVVLKSTDAIAAGTYKSGLFVTEWTGTASNSPRAYAGLNAFAYTHAAATRNLTKTAGYGGLVGGRYGIRLKSGDVDVSKGGGVSSLVNIADSISPTITLGYSYNAESCNAGDSGTITEFAAFLDAGQTAAATNWGLAINTQSYINAALRIGSNVAPISSGLDVTGVSTFGDGGTTNYSSISETGDVVFVGSAGLAYGEIYVADNTITTDLAAQDTWYQITIYNTDGANNNATPDHTNDHITVTKAGHYLVNCHLCIKSAASNSYVFSVFKNNGDTQFANLQGHRQTTVANKPGSLSINGIIDVAANDTIEVWVKRTDGGAVSKSVTIINSALSLVQIGGT